MKKSDVVKFLTADIAKNGDGYAPEKLVLALDSRPWIRREMVTLIKYGMILAILAGIFR